MSSREWKLLGSVWVVGLTLLGVALVVAARFGIDETFAFDTGLGTALLLVAASILFAAVFPALRTNDNLLVTLAATLTAVFGYAGTLIILFDEDVLLFLIVLIYTFYLAFIALVLTVFFRIIRRSFTYLRR